MSILYENGEAGRIKIRVQSGSRSEEKSGYHLEAGVKKNPGTIW